MALKDEGFDSQREEGKARRSESGGPPRENLALLVQGLLTGSVRIQSGRQPINEAFRRNTKASLSEIKRQALNHDYATEDIDDAIFAVVAFLDEAVLSSSDPSATQWARKPLQADLFGESNAGEQFFVRLERLCARRDSTQVADVLEVYLLCLLLGFEGRHAQAGSGELQGMMADLQRRIERVRGSSERLSPDALLPADTGEVPRHTVMTGKWPLIALGCAVFAIFCFVAFQLHLSWKVSDLQSTITSRAPSTDRSTP